MGSRRFLRSLVAGGLVPWGQAMGSVAMVGAEPSLITNAKVGGIVLQCGLPLTAVTSMRPALRHPDLGIVLVGPTFDIQGFGATVPFDASNTPGSRRRCPP